MKFYNLCSIINYMTEFREILKRYHISPLKYDDDVELSESDYGFLFAILSKYYVAKQQLGCRVPKVDETSIRNKIENYCKRTIIPPTIEELMDVLMNQNKGVVL